MKPYRVNVIKKNCLNCGHNKFFIKSGKVINGKYCTKCNSPPMKITQVKNKHNKLINKLKQGE